MSQSHRPSIRQSTRPTVRDVTKWKDTLKQKCLDRVRKRRTLRVQEMRNSNRLSSANAGQDQNDDRIETDSSVIENNHHINARDILNQQLMEDSLHLRVVTTPQRRQLMDSNSTTRNTPNSADSRMLFFSPVSSSNNFDEIDEMYCITEEDFFSLMEELDEELEKEEEYVAEELRIMQERETIEEMLLLEQIESFDKMDLGGRFIPCPVCQSGHLSKDVHSGSISCSNNGCSLSLQHCPTWKEFGKNSSVEEVKDILGRTYEKHAIHCNGILRFDMGNLNNRNGLIVLCNKCSCRDLVVICK